MAAGATPLQKLNAVTNMERAAAGSPNVDFLQYDMGVPTDYTGSLTTNNSRMVLKAKLASTAVGTFVLHYNRIALASVTTLVISKGSATALADVLEQISEQLGLDFEPEDFEHVTLPATGTFVLKAEPGNLIYRGQTNVTVNP